MQYVILVYEGEPELELRQRPEEETFWASWRAYYRSLVDAGVYVGGNALDVPATTATTVRVRGGETHVQDGPYADTKEQLGGFVVLELPTLDAALEWASRCPAARYGAVEVRPIADLTYIFGSYEGIPRDG